MSLPAELQQAIEETGAVVRVRYPWWLRLVLMRGVAGLTLGRRIYVAAGADVARSVRHELVHVRQIARLGALTFYWRWVREYFSNRRRGLTSDQAYRQISFEVEAFAAERDQ